MVLTPGLITANSVFLISLPNHSHEASINHRVKPTLKQLNSNDQAYRSNSVDAGDVHDVALRGDQVRGSQHSQVVDRSIEICI